MMCKKRLAHGGYSVIDSFPWDNPHGKTAGAIRLAGGRREEKYKERRRESQRQNLGDLVLRKKEEDK